MVWKPHVTVAAVIEQNNKFLMVEEQTDHGLQFNQPAGHLEEGEDLISAVIRETFEETAWQFNPEYIVAIQLWRKSQMHPSFLRVCFYGTVHSHQATQKLDPDILATHWLSHAEITQKKSQLRSALVLTSLESYLQGERYPLTLLKNYLDLSL